MSNKPITLSDGKFKTATDGTALTSINANSINSGTLSAIQLPVIPTDKGGFGVDVSTGLTDGYIAVVSGGAITIGPTSPPLISYFTTNSAWTPDLTAKKYTLMLVGGGGGGGSGRQGMSPLNFGGNGGEGGAYTEFDVFPSEVSGAFDIVVGTGGAGGAAVSTNDTDGNNGIAGNPSFIWKSVSTTYLAVAGGGRGGDGGTSAFPTQVYNRAIGTFDGGAGAVGGTYGYPPLDADEIGRAAGGGGGGGGHDILNTQAGSRGAIPICRPGTQATAGAAGGGNGTNGTAPFFPLGPGGGGSGGGSSTFSIGGSGGDGSNGGGGGGGGASTNGFNSGNGGNGGTGWVRIITYYN